MFRKYIAGVSYFENVCQIVVLHAKRKSARIISIHEFRKQYDSPAWFLFPLLDREEKIFRKVKTVAVAVDHERLRFQTFPVDALLDEPAMREHVAWEFAQYLPEGPGSAYVGDMHTLETHPERQLTDALYVAARREFIQTLEAEIKGGRFKCGPIDAAYFGAESAGLLSHPELQTAPGAIIGLFPNHLTVGVLAEGKLIHFASRPVASLSDVLPQLEVEFEHRTIESICAYGPAATASVLNKVRSRFACAVTLLNAFKGLDIDLDQREMQQFLGREHVFAPSVGIALRSS